MMTFTDLWSSFATEKLYKTSVQVEKKKAVTRGRTNQFNTKNSTANQ